MTNKYLKVQKSKEFLFLRHTKKSLTFMILCFIGFLPPSFAFVPGVDRYELSVGTDFPLYGGIQARYNWSTRYYTKVSAGFAIELLMNTHQYVSNSLGFNKDTALISKALVNSVVFDGRMGWAMSIYEGPFIEIAYKLMIWGKGEVKGQDIKTHLGNTIKIDDGSLNEVKVLNHGPGVHIGYRFFLVDKLTLSMDVGLYKPLFSHVTLNYGSVSVPSGSVNKIKKMILQDTWFLSAGLWVGVSF